MAQNHKSIPSSRTSILPESDSGALEELIDSMDKSMSDISNIFLRVSVLLGAIVPLIQELRQPPSPKKRRKVKKKEAPLVLQ